LKKLPEIGQTILSTPSVTAMMIALASESYLNNSGEIEEDKLRENINKIKYGVSAGSQIKIAAAILSLTKDSFVGAGELIKKILPIGAPEDKPSDNPEDNQKVNGLKASP
jgi:hypothetical protein